MEDKVKRAFAEQLNQNQLLWHLLTEFENDTILSWKIANTVEEREVAHAAVMAVAGMRNRIRNELEKLMGRDHARSTDAAA